MTAVINIVQHTPVWVFSLIAGVLWLGSRLESGAKAAGDRFRGAAHHTLREHDSARRQHGDPGASLHLWLSLCTLSRTGSGPPLCVGADRRWRNPRRRYVRTLWTARAMVPAGREPACRGWSYPARMTPAILTRSAFSQGRFRPLPVWSRQENHCDVRIGRWRRCYFRRALDTPVGRDHPVILRFVRGMAVPLAREESAICES